MSDEHDEHDAHDGNEGEDMERIAHSGLVRRERGERPAMDVPPSVRTVKAMRNRRRVIE